MTTSRTKPNMRDNSVILLTITPDFKSRLLKTLFSWLKILLNCIEILFLRYIPRKKTDRIRPHRLCEPLLKALVKITMLTFGCVSPKSTQIFH